MKKQTKFYPTRNEAGYTLSLTNGVVLDRAVTRDTYRRGLISSVSNLVDSTVVSSYQYGYDTLAHATNRNSDAFGYNARSEVSSALILSNAYTYAYDFIGNHTTSTVDSVTTTYSANPLNQYTSILRAPVPPCEPSYDLDGNMLTNGVWSYTYDAENRLTAAYSNSVCVVSNAYDYMSRRVAKWTPSHTTTFVYDGWNLIQETIQDQQSTITNQYVWGKDLSETIQGAGGVGGLLGVSLNGTWYFPCFDNNGNITAYVDESGTLVAEYAYDAFGGTISQAGSMADSFRYRFSTKYYDSETGLYYYGYRFYSPELHRWMNRDPIEEEGGLNLYGFCGNDGMNGVDSLGMTEFSLGLFWRKLTNSEWSEIEQLQASISEQCKTLISNIDSFYLNHFPQAIPRQPRQYAQPRETDRTADVGKIDQNLAVTFYLEWHRDNGTLNWALQHLEMRMGKQKKIVDIKRHQYRMSCKVNPAGLLGIDALKTPLFLGFIKPNWDKLNTSEKRSLLGHETSHWLQATQDYYYLHRDKVIFDAYAWGLLFGI